MDLVACVSTGKGTWGHVGRLIGDGEWDNIFLITNEFGKENFSHEKKFEMVVVNDRTGFEELRGAMIDGMKGKLKGTEVAVNLVSGSGKEHMCLVSALLKLGVGVRFFALTADGVKEL